MKLKALRHFAEAAEWMHAFKRVIIDNYGYYNTVFGNVNMVIPSIIDFNYLPQSLTEPAEHVKMKLLDITTELPRRIVLHVL